MKVAIGSKNPAKVGAVEEVVLPLGGSVQAVSVESGVSDQPFSDEETMQGALNRARNAREALEADWGIGLEGGVVETSFGLFVCNWGALIDTYGNEILAGGASIRLPDEFLQPLRQGEELSVLMEHYTKQKDIRSGQGAVGIFTNGWLDRKEMFAQVMRLLYGQYLFKRGTSS